MLAILLAFGLLAAGQVLEALLFNRFMANKSFETTVFFLLESFPSVLLYILSGILTGIIFKQRALIYNIGIGSAIGVTNFMMFNRYTDGGEKMPAEIHDYLKIFLIIFSFLIGYFIYQFCKRFRLKNSSALLFLVLAFGNLSGRELKVDVCILNDARFEKITARDAADIITSANAALKAAGYELTVNRIVEENLVRFTKRNLSETVLFSTVWDTLEFDPDFLIENRAQTEEYLGKYSLPEQEDICKIKLANKKEYALFLEREYIRRREILINYKINGEYLIRKKVNHFQSFLAWCWLLRKQKKYDLLLTNTFIFYDGFILYPHCVMKDMKVSGFFSPAGRKNDFKDSAAVISTFELFNAAGLFDNSAVTAMPRADRLAYIGKEFLAHEICHKLFELKDEYSAGHNLRCIMNVLKDTKYKPRRYNIDGIICKQCLKSISGN